jgi:hypothetical protein
MGRIARGFGHLRRKEKGEQSRGEKKKLMEEKGQDQGSFNVNESIGHIIMGASH